MKQTRFLSRAFGIPKLPGVSSTVGMGLAIFLGVGPATAAHIETTTELRDACLQSPNRVVSLDHSTKIFDGASPPAPQVPSGCTIVLGPGVNLEFERVSMTFAGPLVIQSAQKGDVKLIKSLLTARSMTFSLAGSGSTLTMTESSLKANSGSLNASFGDSGTLEVIGRPFQGSSEGLSAGNTLQINGGRRFSAVLSHTTVHARHGFRLAMDGGEGLLKLDEVPISAPDGSIVIGSTGAKSLVEMHKATLWFADSASIRLAGRESALSLSQTFVGGITGLPARGGVTLQAASGTAALGKIEASEVSIVDAAFITIRASLNGEQGAVKLQKSTLSAIGNVFVETGTQGATQVTENTLHSDTRIRVATGPGGSCVAEPNSYSAPVVEQCP